MRLIAGIVERIIQTSGGIWIKSVFKSVDPLIQKE